MKKIIAFLLVLTMLLSLVACTQKPAKETTAQENTGEDAGKFDGQVYVGLIYAQTGNATYLGTCNYHAISAAVKEINEAGGILGKEVVLVTEDEGETVDSSVKAMQKLLEDERLIAACGSLYSPRAIAAVPYVEEREIPVFVFGSSDELVSKCGDWVWMTRPPDKFNGKATAKYLVENLKCKNPAVIYATDAYGDGYRVSLQNALAEYNITLDEKLVFGISPDDTNFSNQIAQIAASDADCLVAIGTNPAPYIVSQVADAKLDIPLMGSAAFCNDTVFSQCGQAANGWYTVADWSTDLSTPAAEKFKATLMEMVGNLDTSCQACCYPSIYLLKAACEKAGTTEDPAAINAALYEIEIESVTGKMKYNGDHSFATQVIVTQNKDGRPALIDTVVFR
ncbi:MAG: ABC transporter substrate-binding protein [Lutisporaceae bacterium]|jgi:branched-chain amino acid transport system substrate-binding protein